MESCSAESQWQKSLNGFATASDSFMITLFLRTLAAVEVLKHDEIKREPSSAYNALWQFFNGGISDTWMLYRLGLRTATWETPTGIQQ